MLVTVLLFPADGFVHLLRMVWVGGLPKNFSSPPRRSPRGYCARVLEAMRYNEQRAES